MSNPPKKSISNRHPYDPTYNYNIELRQRFPVCCQCGDKLIDGTMVVALKIHNKIYAQFCSDQCADLYAELQKDQIKEWELSE